ncbi:MAG: DNA damage-inducible protein D [Candidatus Stygibacter frigidus]|nr:DNA damage-inducible protein D [Candidatus Stygibacter frigidus]
MANDIMVNKQDSIFESIKKTNEFGSDIWFARNLSEVLDYTKWANFEKVIKKAMIACETSGNEVSDHFAEVGKMINLPKGANREINDFVLSRYACYLIIQEADPRKEVVALGKTYFAIQTRKQELQEQFDQLSEDKKRLAIRNELKNHNKQLADAAKDAGVETNTDYAAFQNYGYMGLYGGLKATDIHARKGLKKSYKILDYMGSTELAANLFRATQTEEKLKRESIKGKTKANKIHYDIGHKVRQTIKEIGGTMPENLPTPEKSVKKIAKEVQKQLEDDKDF